MATRITYGLAGSLASLVLAWPAGVLMAASQDTTVAVLCGLAFWLVGTTASVRVPELGLRRLERPLARMLFAPLLVGVTAGLTGLFATLVTAVVARHDSNNFGIVLYLSLVFSLPVASIGLPLQGLLEVWLHVRRRWWPAPPPHGES